MSGRPPDETPGPSGDVQSVAYFRRKMAALQSQLADVQRVLAEEQRERAEEADQLAAMLAHVAAADARVRNATRELEEEREVSLQLGKEVTQKEQECVALRGEVQDLEQRLEQIAVLEQELGTTKEQLVEHHAREGELKRQLLDAISEVAALKAAAAELASAKHALEESQKDAAAKAQEIERVNAQLKQANMKAFTANKQHETWKVESQRTIDQLRKEQELKLAAVSKRLETSEAQQKTMRQHMEAAIKVLTLTSQALEAAETADAEIQKLRDAQETKRRQILEEALGVRNELRRAAEEPTVEVSEADWFEPDEPKSQ